MQRVRLYVFVVFVWFGLVWFGLVWFGLQWNDHFQLAYSLAGGKSLQAIETKGQNINITWSHDGNFVAAGNKVSTRC